MLISMAHDIKRDVHAIQKSIKYERGQIHTLKMLTKFIQFHSYAIQLSELKFLLRIQVKN